MKHMNKLSCGKEKELFLFEKPGRLLFHFLVCFKTYLTEDQTIFLTIMIERS